MSGKTHFISGTLAGGIFVVGMDLPLTKELGVFLISCSLGSGLPDLDEPKSILGRKVPLLPSLIKRFFGHRTLFHCLIFPTFILGCYLFQAFPQNYALLNNLVIGLLLGYFSHLVLDTYTVLGVPWLYPIIKTKFRIIGIPSGHWVEYIFAFFTLIGFAFLMFQPYLLRTKEFLLYFLQ